MSSELEAEHGQADRDQKPALQVLERTFGILESFTETSPEWRTTDLARRVGLPVPTVHRILGALTRLGYLTQHEDTKRFGLGLAALALGERARAVADLRPVAIEPPQRLERTFGILESFTETNPEWRTTDLARSAALPVPTVHRILAALTRLGYLSQNEDTKRFRLGLAALTLGERARAVADLRPVAIEPLRRLSAATGETALLTILTPERDRAVCLERVETSRPLRLSVQPGRQLPLHAGASQKALLAFMPEHDINQVLAQPLEQFCQFTITSPAAMRRELETIRERGWAGSYEETNLGVWGIAVPVLSDSDVICAVGIAGPSARLSSQRVRKDIRLAHESALAIGRALGFTSPPVITSNARIEPR